MEKAMQRVEKEEGSKERVIERKVITFHNKNFIFNKAIFK